MPSRGEADRDGDWVSHGASVPLAGAALFLAMDLHATAVSSLDAGLRQPRRPRPRRRPDRPGADVEAKAHMSQTEIINFSLRGNSTFQFLRPLQIDPIGNVNVSLVERPGKPPLRFQGRSPSATRSTRSAGSAST